MAKRSDAVSTYLDTEERYEEFADHGYCGKSYPGILGQASVGRPARPSTPFIWQADTLQSVVTVKNMPAKADSLSLNQDKVVFFSRRPYHLRMLTTGLPSRELHEALNCDCDIVVRRQPHIHNSFGERNRENRDAFRTDAWTPVPRPYHAESTTAGFP